MSRLPPYIVPAATLRAELSRALAQHFGKPRRIVRLRRRASPYASSFAIENLEVELDHGREMRLVFKDLSPGALLPAARRVRPDFLYDPRRELEVYRGMLRAPGWGTPICYGAVARDRGARYWLLLERVPGPLLWQVGRFDAWLEAARWLARLHERGGFRSERLLPYDRKYYQSWLARAQDFLRQRKPPPARAVQSRFERLAGRYDRVVRRLLDWPATFIHGEFYPSNVIVRAGRKRNRICPIDWESAARGPGPVDLAALVSGDWSEDRKTAMISAYRRALRRRPPLAELVEVVDYCQLHLAMRSLGWARAWSPPAPHARDWLREALRLAEKLAI